MMKKLLLCIQIIGFGGALLAQTPRDIATEYIRNNASTLGLTAADVSSVRVTDQYTSRHNNVTHVYFVQQYNGIDIPSATYGVHVKDGKVLTTGDRFVRDVASKISDGWQIVSAEEAVGTSLSALGAQVRGPLAVKEKVDAARVVFHAGAHALQDFPAHLIYTPVGERFELAWETTIEPVTSGDLWSVRVNASSGEVINKVLRTTYCEFPDHYMAREHACADHAFEAEALSQPAKPLAGDGAQYNVVAIPNESPKHAAREMIVDPSDPDASPFGWHDTDGVDGAEYTITRGNNVHSYLDRDGNNSADGQVDGGADLVFDFPFDVMLEPTDNVDAGVTNLFYMNNIMHDFSYHYGFDELSGNFQQINTSGSGTGGDYVMAQAQFGADQVDPPLNNATFSTPADGGNGRMRMYVWTAAGGDQLLRVDSPAEVAGKYQTSTTTTEWGAAITAVPLTGEVAIVDDGSGNPTQGCNTLDNATEIEGKIALIDRGNCEFGVKALNAQNAGAIGFIICNFEEGYVNMAPGAVGTQVTIPGIFIANSDCQKIRVFAGAGLTLSFVNEGAGTGPSQRDGSVDNSVIAHEYGHGISNRLTGGPSQAGCLSNYDNDNDGTVEDGEQMGEGWSDFFSLVTTVRPGDTKDIARGIATYSNGQEPNGVGLRSYAYATDMNVNPLTYDDIAFQSVPHGIGTVWCSALWDLYWALSDEYGWDPDLYRGTGGNNLAIQLVMDGMKLQTCRPGLLDGRDAILAADIALTGGANQKLIWEVFARRGMGFSAIQGEDRFRHDNSEAFDVSPYAIRELKIVKHLTPWIESGDQVDVELWAVNHKDDAATTVVVTDFLPEGTTYINGTASHPLDIQGDMLMFELGDIPSGDTIILSYSIATDPALFSERYFKDDVEGDIYWDPVIDDHPILLWQPQDLIVNSGDFAWFVENIDTLSDQSIVMIDPIVLPNDNPALIFFQNYDTERFFDAGIVQVSDDGGLSWHTPGVEHVIRGDYSGKVPFALFAIPRVKAWHGSSGEWVQTIVDLTEYAGQEILVRFRFASDGNTAGLGWFIDDIELVDLFSYNAEACITSGEGDNACAEAARRGAIVASKLPVSTKGPDAESFDLNVYPNPARNFVTVDIVSEHSQHAEIALVNNAGQLIWQEKVTLPAGTYMHGVDTRNLPEGFYFIRVQGERDQAIRKIVVQ